MAEQTPASSLAFNFSLEYRNVVDGHFLRRMLDDDLSTVRGDSWITAATIEDAPGAVLSRVDYFHSARLECLVAVDRAIAHLMLCERLLTVRVAGVDSVTCDTAIARIKSAMPEVDGADQLVPVRFWWWQPSFAQEMARMMPAPSWDEIASNYSQWTVPALEPLMSWSSVPSAGGRLVLWHGAPGTGKTTAVRALAWQWRAWAEFQFITDPEQFLSNPSYLLRTISEAGRSSLVSSPADQWRILVLEDSGEYLAPDAKHLAGQALSRLLNVCDGVLGQATRTLVLVTTNERLQTLHPALSRAGRCLVQVEFSELATEEIERWCRLRDLAPPQTSRAPLADLFAHANGRPIAPTAPGFGFSAAA